MSEIMEQRSAIKFCVRNGISAAETLRMCQKAYGDGALSQARVFAWHRMFKEGRESVQDEPRAGRPSTSTDVIHVQKIRDLVLANRRLTHDNAPSHTSLVVRDHFAKNSTHIIPQPPYSPDLAPCDFWLFSKLKRPLRGHRFEPIEEIKEKTMIYILLWAKSIDNFKFKFLWADNSWLLHHDNAPSHTSLVVRDHFAKNSTHIIPQPPYSPDLAPCDFWLFSKLKRPLRGHRFETIEEIKEKTTSELRAIPTDDYAACFENWKKRWHSCIATGGDYFEGDDTNLDE
ncbi:SETMR methyltransferase, partial [Acromyrmex insinuator]